MVVHAFNPSTSEFKDRQPGLRGLQSEFQDSQGYTEKLSLKKEKEKKLTN